MGVVLSKLNEERKRKTHQQTPYQGYLNLLMRITKFHSVACYLLKEPFEAGPKTTTGRSI